VAHAAEGTDYLPAIGNPQSFAIAKATPTISISNIPIGAVYDDILSPVYAYTGAGKASATSDTPGTCTVGKNGRVSFVGVGTCTLVAHATATANYEAATGSPQSFTIAQAIPTITIKNLPNNPKKGGSFAPTYKYTGDGVPSVISSTPGTCTVTGGVVSYVAAGTCTLTAQATATAHYAAATGSPQAFTIK
jgi:hypothetical protein